MAKKKKAKVRTLTEKQYNDYLRPHKAGRPPTPTDKAGKRPPQR